MTNSDSTAHLIIMAIGLVLCVFVFFVKGENDEDINIRIEFTGILVNVLSILVLAAMKLLSFKANIGFLGILVVIFVFANWQIQFFNINFEL